MRACAHVSAGETAGAHMGWERVTEHKGSSELRKVVVVVVVWCVRCVRLGVGVNARDV